MRQRAAITEMSVDVVPDPAAPLPVLPAATQPAAGLGLGGTSTGSVELAGIPFSLAAPAGPRSAAPVVGAYGGPVYAPFSDTDKLKRQASHFLNLLNTAEGHKALNASWAQGFWQSVHLVTHQYHGQNDPVAPDLLRLFEAHGFIGFETKSPPRDGLRHELVSLQNTAAPSHGASMAHFGQPITGGFGSPTRGSGFSSSAWHTRPPADMERAGP